MLPVNQMLAGLRDLVDNPTPRVPVILCLDVSSSMQGRSIAELNGGIQQFLDPCNAKKSATKIAAFFFAL